GSSQHAVAPTVAHPKPPKPKPKQMHRAARHHTQLIVTILDGDRRVRVRGAQVSLLGRSGRTDRHGVTVFKAPRRRLEVSVSARGYSPERFNVNFRRRYRQTLRIYQPDLQWPLYGATRARTQAPADIRLRPPFRLIWSRGLGHLIEFPAVVWNGFAYIGSQYGTVGGAMYALDLRRHRLQWKRYLGAKITSSAAIAGKRLFIGDYAGRLWALSPATGSTRWIGTVNGKIYGTPAVSHGRVFVPSSTGNSLTAFTTSGRYLWRNTAGYYVYSSPAVADGVVCWGSYTGWFYGSSAATGRILWRIPTGG